MASPSNGPAVWQMMPPEHRRRRSGGQHHISARLRRVVAGGEYEPQHVVRMVKSQRQRNHRPPRMADDDGSVDAKQGEGFRQQSSLSRCAPGVAPWSLTVPKPGPVDATARCDWAAWSSRPLMMMSSTMAPLPCRITTGGPLPRSK